MYFKHSYFIEKSLCRIWFTPLCKDVISYSTRRKCLPPHNRGVFLEGLMSSPCIGTRTREMATTRWEPQWFPWWWRRRLATRNLMKEVGWDPPSPCDAAQENWWWTIANNGYCQWWWWGFKPWWRGRRRWRVIRFKATVDWQLVGSRMRGDKGQERWDGMRHRNDDILTGGS